MGIDDRDYMRERYRARSGATKWNDRAWRVEGTWFDPINRAHDYQRGHFKGGGPPVRVRLRWLHLSVEDGWVTLSGEVDWQYQRENAEQALQRLLGVTGISNEIVIKKQVDAGHISDEIMHALHRSWFFDPKTIDVRVDDGTVHLTGTVHSPHDRQLAAASAWAAPGVIDVRNDIAIV